MSRPRRYIEGAYLDGWPAYCFARILARHWKDDVEDLPPHLRTPLEDAREALEHAARHYATTARGSAEAAPAETAAPLNHEDSLTTAEVADLLEVTERRVRQLATAGALAGRQRGGGAGQSTGAR